MARIRVVSVQWIDLEVVEEEYSMAQELAGEFYYSLEEVERDMLPSSVAVIDLDSSSSVDIPLLELAQGEFRPVNVLDEPF